MDEEPTPDWTREEVEQGYRRLRAIFLFVILADAAIAAYVAVATTVPKAAIVVGAAVAIGGGTWSITYFRRRRDEAIATIEEDRGATGPDPGAR